MISDNMCLSNKADDIASAHVGETGFTLVELILGTLIFSILALLVFSTFGTVLKSVEPIEKGLENRTTTQDFVNLFRKDLNSLILRLELAYNPPDINDDPDIYRFVGVNVSMGEHQGSRLRFVSGNHIPFDGISKGQAGCIVYHVRGNGTGGYDIRRYDSADIDANFSDDELHPAVLKNVVEFKLSYLDGEGNNRDDWDSESDSFRYGTPRAVFLRVGIQQKDSVTWFDSVIALPVVRAEREG